MARRHPVYRSFVLLYPGEFRREYGEDLVAHYAELVADRGAPAARTRTALDLAVTIPRYHLERLMTEQHSATVLGIVIGLLALGAIASTMTGLGPGVVLAIVAVVLAVAQRSTLARALRVPNSTLRRRRLRTAGVLGVVFVASYVMYVLLIGESWTARETVLSIIGTAAMVGAVGYFIAGLLTPRSPTHHVATSAG